MNYLRPFLGTAAAALIAGSAAAQDSITTAMQLEPPHLDPTSAAAGAIDSVLYSNVFEGLTRFMSDGAVVPGLAGLGRGWVASGGIAWAGRVQTV